MGKWADRLGDSSRAAEYQAHYEASLRAFDQFFFDASKGYLRNFEANESLSADANFTAVAESLLPFDQASTVMRTLRASPIWGSVPGRATWPDFPAEMKSKFVKRAEIPDYHDRLNWVWLGAEAAMADRALGRREACEETLDALSRIIVNYSQVYEVYAVSTKKPPPWNWAPVKRILYGAEGPFTWSSAKVYEAQTRGCAGL